MKNLSGKPPRRLPTILGLLFLVASLFVGVFLVRSNQLFFLRADPEIAPQEVKITNVTDTSFAVSWMTAKETGGFVQIEKEGRKEIFADDRDQFVGQVEGFTTHHVTLKNLEPNQKYFFKIGSGGKMFGDENNEALMATTGPSITRTPPVADPAYGKIEADDGSSAEGAIVYLNLPDTVLQSALVKSSGSWLVTISSARSADLTAYTTYDQQAAIEDIFVQGGDLGTAAAVFTTQADSPAETLILNKGLPVQLTSQADQTTQITQPVSTVTPTFSLSASTQSSGFGTNQPLPSSFVPQIEVDLEISYPSDGELISTQKPEFFGKAPQGSVLTIIVNSQGFFGEVIADQQGSWSWSPPENLGSGDHKILVRYQDAEGQTKTIERPFTVLAADNSDLPSFVSTPAATPLPSPTPTLPPRQTQPSTDSGIPQPGVLTPTFLVSIMGIVLFVLGIFLKKDLNLAS